MASSFCRSIKTFYTSSQIWRREVLNSTELKLRSNLEITGKPNFRVPLESKAPPSPGRSCASRRHVCFPKKGRKAYVSIWRRVSISRVSLLQKEGGNGRTARSRVRLVVECSEGGGGSVGFGSTSREAFAMRWRASRRARKRKSFPASDWEDGWCCELAQTTTLSKCKRSLSKIDPEDSREREVLRVHVVAYERVDEFDHFLVEACV